MKKTTPQKPMPTGKPGSGKKCRIEAALRAAGIVACRGIEGKSEGVVSNMLAKVSSWRPGACVALATACIALSGCAGLSQAGRNFVTGVQGTGEAIIGDTHATVILTPVAQAPVVTDPQVLSVAPSRKVVTQVITREK